jgi:hypothetical protein
MLFGPTVSCHILGATFVATLLLIFTTLIFCATLGTASICSRAEDIGQLLVLSQWRRWRGRQLSSCVLM